MDSLVSIIQGSSFEETCIRIVCFIAIMEFIGCIFAIFGNMRR